MLEKIEKFQVLLLGLVIGIAGIIATVIISNTLSKDVISVTGSYSQIVTSDKGSYEFDVESRGASRAAAYAVLQKQKPIIIKYLKSQGFKDSQIEEKYINGYNVYRTTANGNTTNDIIGFNATQKFAVSSDNVKKIKKISTDINSLTEQGINISGYEPSYFYSKLSDLKIEMLEKASLDAKQRAKAMLKATHNRVGKIQSLQMGVFQITPEDSNNVSDSGISDTSSIKKKVTSVANVTFRIK
ncbi:MAG TPA: SIMPL domain-containing protein [Cyanobacteria bacterium UBA11991]|nr:SIMPL domain-containing protein [Cyanobacteriota bacterium]MDY6358494.1 SIMPL domain-containing protein [Cyanobacteriota bacterium]MDY6364022.1 SIMPL domain-containing protein [Cyanobacteriota bacterium]MDY6382919.1 SIMPL domain-containing protein [Cyanobacteriota bacterium]HCB11242.1 SIMPL domain-containing protein [Cyanobacteria bacterium UBA11991]